MAKNPWADDPDMKALRISTRTQRGSAPWAGLLVGLAFVAFGTFIFGFYLPLYRAHQTANASYQRIMQQVKSLEDTATQAQAALKAEIAKRETLEAEKRQREGASKGSSGELESVRAALAQKLEGPISKKQAGVALDGDRLVVVLGSGALFSTGKVEVSGGGKNVLCDIAKAAGQRPLRVEAATDADGVPVMLKIKYTNAWALTGAATSSVANTLADKCSVQGPKLSATGYAENKPPRKALEATKIGGLRIELEIGGAERKP
jgi:flagellar motor protein MotB